MLLLTATPVTAHQGDPNIATLIDAIEPPLPDVTVEIRAGAADQLLVVNPTDAPVEVLGRDGQPFLRIGPDTVEADTTHADFVTSNAPFAGVDPPDVPAEWRVVAKGGSWGWFDHRLHDRPLAAPAARAVTRLADWTVPLRHRGTTHTVRGHVEYRPPLGTFRSRAAKVPEGVDLDVLDGRVPGLFLTWRGSGTLTVRGIEGEPFARFTSTGVQVNAASATWQDDQRLRGQIVTVPADPAAPRWRNAGHTASLTWLDRRLAYAPGTPPDDPRRETTMVEWDIAVDVDGRPGHLQGVTTWVPLDPAGESTRAWLPYAVPAALALLVVLVALRRRTGR